MSPQKNTARQSLKDSEENALILYRLRAVEEAVRELSSKVDKQDNIKRSDLKEFQETIVGRFIEMRTDLQRQVDDKADLNTVTDLKRLVYSFFGFFSTVIAGIIVYYVTHVRP